MEDPLLYNRKVEDSIDLFKEEIKDEYQKTLPSFVEFGGPLLTKKGKQGLVGLLLNKKNHQRYVYKISQYLDFIIDQEYTVMKDLNTLRDYCPHFVKVFGKFKLPVSANYSKSKNPFDLEDDYKNILTDMIVMENLENCDKFYNYIKNSSYTTTELLSVVKQTLLAADIAYQKLQFTHYDLHSDNILIKKCDPNSVFIYIINDEYYIVPTYGLCSSIIDFGFSYSKGCDQQPMNCTLAHTKYGFTQCKEDRYNDAKLLLVTVSDELKQQKGDSDALIFRNIVKNLYKNAHVEFDSGWDTRQRSSLTDEFLEDFDRIFTKSGFFDRQADYIIDILQTLIVLPLKYRRSNEKTKELLSLLINEYSKIEKVIADDFYNLFILKEIIISANKNRELYTTEKTRNEAVTNFKNDILTAVDRIAKYCNPKLNWERLLCCLLCLGKNLENYFHDKIEYLFKVKNKDYSTIPLKTNLEMYKALEANIPSDFTFTKHTIVYTWNFDKENSTKTKIDHRLVDILNNTHPFERGLIYKDYVDHPEHFEDIYIKESSEESQRSQSSQRSKRSQLSKHNSSKQSSRHSSQHSTNKKHNSKESSSLQELEDIEYEKLLNENELSNKSK